MNFLKNFFKKYSALLLPGVLVAVAFLLLIPTMLIGRGLSKKMATSIQMSTNLSRLAGSTPSQATVDDAGRYVERYKKEAQAIANMAVDTSRRDLIQYGLFPKPDDDSAQVYSNFGNRFRAMIEGLMQLMNAKDAPSKAEIDNRMGFTVNQPGGGMEMFGGAGGNPATANNAKDDVLDAICLERAEQISVYAEPGGFSIYNFWEKYTFPGREQAIKDCWYSQVAQWIYEDVAVSIKALNVESKRVDDSPVKRLLGVSFQGPVMVQGSQMMGGGMFGGGFMGGGMNTAVLDKPIYLTAMQRGPFLQNSWTGRGGSEDLDVIHFAISAIVESGDVLSFCKELCSSKPHQYRENFQADGKLIDARHNQITILETTISSVDPTLPEHLYYRYGSAGVLRVDLVCEYLFLRAGYDSIKPESIKAEGGAGAGGAAPGMQDPGMAPMPFM